MYFIYLCNPHTKVIKTFSVFTRRPFTYLNLFISEATYGSQESVYILKSLNPLKRNYSSFLRYYKHKILYNES